MTYSEIMQAWKKSTVWSVRPLTPYEKRKFLARDLAIEWQYHWSEMPFDAWEDFKCRTFFENVGRRYGLLREFRENGII